jgi:NAD-dependent DNA ligase
LGFFKFKEKTACKETIQQAERVLSGLPAERNRLSVAYQNKKSDIDKKVRAGEAKLKAKIEKENQIPIEPQKPAAYKPASTSAPKRTKKSSQTPDKIFLGYTFVVADMPSGSEDARIRREIKLRGGTPVTSVTQKLDYLVCSRVARGITTRIDAALDNQAKGFPVKIITIREFDEMISKE